MLNFGGGDEEKNQPLHLPLQKVLDGIVMYKSHIKYYFDEQAFFFCHRKVSVHNILTTEWSYLNKT